MKIIVNGAVKGEALVSKDAISFFGDVDVKTGKIINKDIDIYGEILKDKILVFKQGKGSTVGSYIIYRMKKIGTAPKAMIVEKAEPIIVVGCVIAKIPLIEAKENIKSGETIKISEKGIEVVSK